MNFLFGQTVKHLLFKKGGIIRVIAIFITLTLSACGESVSTQTNTPLPGTDPVNYTGPAPRTDDTIAFKQYFWDNLSPDNRCGSCHTTGGEATDKPFVDKNDINTAYYLRLSALDKPGVLSDVAQIISNAGISIEALIQKEPLDGADHVPLILLTNRTTEKFVLEAVSQIEALQSIEGSVAIIRVETLDS